MSVIEVWILLWPLCSCVGVVYQPVQALGVYSHESVDPQCLNLFEGLFNLCRCLVASWGHSVQ